MKTLPIIFTYKDLKETYPVVSAFYSFVNRSLTKGSIKQIKKGLYALVDPSTGDIYANKFQICSALFADSYFSYHEALEYYGLANQSFVSTFNYLSHRYNNGFEFNGIIYTGKKCTNQLFVLNRYEEEGIRVVSLERAIIDSIDDIEMGGGLEEVEYALDCCPKLDLDDITSLLEDRNNMFLYQKVGYLFEKHFKEDIPSSFYEYCL